LKQRRAKQLEKRQQLLRRKERGGMCPGQIGRGKYAGLTIPQLFFVDPDHFYWGVNSRFFRGSADFARDMAQRTRHIRPPQERETWNFGMRFDDQRQLKTIMLLRPENTRAGCIISPHLDCQIYRDCGVRPVDSLTIILNCIVRLYFGGENPMHSHLRCEQFFTTDRNFGLQCHEDHRLLVADATGSQQSH
jgi:hypothetical protein